MDNLPAQQDSSDLTHVLPTGLTSEEVNFVYNAEVLGLPVRKAATMAGMPHGRIVAPHIIQARETVKREIRGALAVTREDIVFGMQEAIGRAIAFGEPLTEITGWKEIAKVLGLAEPKKVEVNVSSTLEALQVNVRGMTDQELLKHLGASDIIDADFYEVRD